VQRTKDDRPKYNARVAATIIQEAKPKTGELRERITVVHTTPKLTGRHIFRIDGAQQVSRDCKNLIHRCSGHLGLSQRHGDRASVNSD
jgi:hypothetical protein